MLSENLSHLFVNGENVAMELNAFFHNLELFEFYILQIRGERLCL